MVTEEGREGLAVQYWLYYPFNDFNNKHESDWEMIQVEFAASDAATALTQDPTRVGYSQHEGVEIADWGDVKLEVVDGTHPVVHPAAGSHANYYDAALFLGRSGQQGFGCDDTPRPDHRRAPRGRAGAVRRRRRRRGRTRGWTTPAAGASARRASTTARPAPTPRTSGPSR